MSASTPSGTNPLADVLSGATRQRVYVGYSVVVLLLGGVQVGYATAGAGLPLWLTIGQNVALYLGAALGLTAASNITTRGRHAARE